MIENPGSGEKKLDVEDELRKEGVEIVRSEPLNPAPISFEEPEHLPERERVNFHRFLDALHFACFQYANGILMRDPFGNEHTTRRVPWRRRMQEQYGDAFQALYSQNKLTWNMVQGVPAALHATIDQLNARDIHTRQAEALRAEHEKVPLRIRTEAGVKGADYYGMLSDDEKNQIVSTIDAIAREIFAILTNPASIDEPSA